jgi:ATP-dependent protease HslVU (ClpYQ) peptidase subunit
MTTILAVKKKGSICIGADTLTIIAGGRKQTSADLVNCEKIIQYESNYIGINGDYSLFLAIKTILTQDRRKRSFTNEENIFNEISKLHITLKDEFALIPSAEEDSFESSQFELLIVNPHGIFKTYELRSVQQFARFYAIGSGASYALGAIESLYNENYSAEEIAKKSLEVASEFDDATGLPGTFYSVKLPNTHPVQT